MVLHRDELGPAIVLRRHLQFDELPRVHRRRPQVQRLAGLHHVVQGLHRLLDRRLHLTGNPVRMAVDDQLVHVVEAETPQAAVDPFHDVLARQPALVRRSAHRHGDLGREDVLVAWQQLPQQRPDHPLAGADAVDVGAVEVEQPALDRGLEDRTRSVQVERPVTLVAPARLAEVHRPQAQLRDPEPALPSQLNRLQHVRAFTHVTCLRVPCGVSPPPSTGRR